MTITESLNAKTTLHYVHGWASNPTIWGRLITCLPSHKSILTDLAFFTPPMHEKTKEETDFLITHSLGAMWALKNGYQPKKGMIVISGFQDFMAFTPSNSVQAMMKGLDRNPQLQINTFAKAADMPVPDGNVDVSRLKEGLDWLQSWNIEKDIAALNIPIVVLAGAQDRICPLTALQDQWYNHDIVMNNEAGHGLPHTHAEWCADQIQQWMENLQ